MYASTVPRSNWLWRASIRLAWYRHMPASSWFSYPERVTFKLCLTTYRFLHGLAPPHLTRFCTPLSAVAGRTHLRSVDQHKLFVPCTSTSTFGSRAFSSSSPLSWNALLSQLRDPAISINIFRQSLKTHLFNNISDWLCVIVILYIYCVFLGTVLRPILVWGYRHCMHFRDSFCLASML